MFNLYPILRSVLFLFDPELIHKFTIRYFKLRNFFYKNLNDDIRLRTSIAGLNLSNPIGVAAGLDKNGEAIHGIHKLGFGFIEVGSVTPIPQDGNPKPRLYRLKEDEAVINRMGFNNAGHFSVLKNINKVRDKPIIVGVNLGANRDTKDFFNDYVKGLKTFINSVDYIVINISSPNTPGLRDLQDENNLKNLLDKVRKERQLFPLELKKIPIILKISPDLSDLHINRVVDLSLKYKVDALIIGNTTSERRLNLKNKNRNQTGGLSGKPIFYLSTKKLAIAYKYSKGKIPIIGVGGISSGEDAYEKICAGATALQIYSALIFKGPKIVELIKKQIIINMKKDRFNNISEAVGSKNSKYLS